MRSMSCCVRMSAIQTVWHGRSATVTCAQAAVSVDLGLQELAAHIGWIVDLAADCHQLPGQIVSVKRCAALYINT